MGHNNKNCSIKIRYNLLQNLLKLSVLGSFPQINTIAEAVALACISRKKIMFKELKIILEIIDLIHFLFDFVLAVDWFLNHYEIILAWLYHLPSEPFFSHAVFIISHLLASIPIPEILIQILG